MKKTMIAIMAFLFCFSIAIARYVKSTFTPFPEISQLDEYVVNITYSYNHLFDMQAKTLDELLVKADAVVLAEASDEGNYAAFSLRRKIHVNECFKGNIEDEVTYYDPVIISANTTHLSVTWESTNTGKRALSMMEIYVMVKSKPMQYAYKINNLNSWMD